MFPLTLRRIGSPARTGVWFGLWEVNSWLLPVGTRCGFRVVGEDHRGNSAEYRL